MSLAQQRPVLHQRSPLPGSNHSLSPQPTTASSAAQLDMHLCARASPQSSSPRSFPPSTVPPALWLVDARLVSFAAGTDSCVEGPQRSPPRSGRQSNRPASSRTATESAAASSRQTASSRASMDWVSYGCEADLVSPWRFISRPSPSTPRGLCRATSWRTTKPPCAPPECPSAGAEPPSGPLGTLRRVLSSTRSSRSLSLHRRRGPPPGFSRIRPITLASAKGFLREPQDWEERFLPERCSANEN